MRKMTISILNALLDNYPQLNQIEQNIIDSVELAISTFSGGNKLLICGNGGSAADCDHITGELMKSFVLKRELTKAQKKLFIEKVPHHAELLNSHLQQALPAISLSAHTALLTAFSNDAASDLAFAQQVLGYGREEDLLLAISTSGTSKNVVYAAEVAGAIGLKVIALTGQSGGVLGDICDVLINVPENETYRVQELHLPYYHAFCMALENEFFGDDEKC